MYRPSRAAFMWNCRTDAVAPVPEPASLPAVPPRPALPAVPPLPARPSASPLPPFGEPPSDDASPPAFAPSVEDDAFAAVSSDEQDDETNPTPRSDTTRAARSTTPHVFHPGVLTHSVATRALPSS